MANLQTAQVANYDFGATAAAIALAAAASATIVLSGQPTSGQLVVISTVDGVVTYEFTSSTPAAGHVGVTIGGADTDTAAALVAAINANQNVTAALATLTITVTDHVTGSLTNQNTISTNATNVAVTAWAGGSDDSSSVGLLEFMVKGQGGGKLDIHFEVPVNGPNGIGIRPPTNALVLSLQVSPDGKTWNATTNSNNGTAVTGVTVGPGQDADYTVILRAGVDKFLRLNGTGPGRGTMQVRSKQSVGLDIVEI